MSKKIRHQWETHNIRTSAAEKSRAERDVLESTSKSINNFRNQDDINWLESLLVRWPELTEVHRQKILASIEWLKECSTRTLGEEGGRRRFAHSGSWRAFYAKIEFMLKRGIYSSFQEREKTEEESHMGQRRRVCRAYRAREVKSKPDWMTDSSRLPKAPPGREGTR